MSFEHESTLDPRIERVALRKLLMLDAAETLDDLRVPPGNRLEALRGDRVGQHSIGDPGPAFIGLRGQARGALGLGARRSGRRNRRGQRCVHAASACGLGALAAKPLKPPFFKWISSSEMAAGVTPLMRPA